MVLPEINTGLLILKTFKDLIKGVSSLSSDAVIKEKTSEIFGIIVDLQEYIFSMQSKYSELVKSKNDLEKKLIKLKKWEKTKSQYQLKEIARGTFVYSYKKSDEHSDPHHWLCTNCYEEGKKSILQISTSKFCYICPKCETKITYPDSKPIKKY